MAQGNRGRSSGDRRKRSGFAGARPSSSSSRKKQAAGAAQASAGDGSENPAVKVAIVGGGCAGLAAAWELSKRTGYEVTVYEKSWRLGGKGASGRGANGRIEEHGLHIWLGFYENAFRMMRECYAEVETRRWGPRADKVENRLTHGSMDAAFFPEPHIGVAIPDSTEDSTVDPGKKWVVWSGYLPPAKGMPGDGLDEESNPFTLANYLLRCIELLKALMLSVIGPPDEPKPGKPRPDERSELDEAIELNFAFDPVRSPEILVKTMTRYLRAGALTTAAGLLQAVTILENWLHKLNLSPQVADTALRLMEAVAAQTRKVLRDLVQMDKNIRWKTEVIDIVITIAVGLYRDRVLFEDSGLDAINHIDYKDWLLQHGATNTAVESQFINGIYDLTFAYRDGDRKCPRLAAGVALRGALRMFFTYRGSMFWRMRSGMGDAVFAPLYKVLRARNVRFEFLHALQDVEFHFEPGRTRRVARLNFDRTGSMPDDEVLDKLGCWPSAKPAAAASEPRPKEAGTDFHCVIFATGKDDFVEVLSRSGDSRGKEKRGFFQELPEWSAMADKVETVATQAAQVWLRRDLEELGWLRGSGVITAFEPPFETWADMTHTYESEKAWRRAHGKAETDGTRSIAYFCGVLSDRDARLADDQLQKKVAANFDDLLKRRIRPLWPAAFEKEKKKGKEKDWEAEPTAATFQIDDPYVKANTAAADRYTLSLPGSIEHRISPLDLSVQNMTIAGDWTANGLDAGCVESAVMSGMLAAFAITEDDASLDAALKTIIGYDHP